MAAVTIPCAVIQHLPKSLTNVASDPRSSNAFRATPYTSFDIPTEKGLMRDGADEVAHVVVQFCTLRQGPGTVDRTGDDPVAAELAALILDLGFQEPIAGVATSHTGLKQEMRKDVYPANHGM
jgi:hypothetical protein